MASIARKAADLVGRILGVTIVHPGTVGVLYEREHLERFLREFRVDCLFDVGANEGQYAQMIRTLGFRGPIVSFEPNPDVAAILRGHAKRDPNWFVEEVALDETERETHFNIMQFSQFSSLNTPSHSETTLFLEDNEVTKTVALRTALLSQYFERYQARLHFSRPFLKLDTQGHDLAVARGARPYLEAFVGVQSEVAVKRIYETSDDYRTSLAFYLEAGFEISAFVPNNRGHFPAMIEFDSIFYNPRFTA